VLKVRIEYMRAHLKLYALTFYNDVFVHFWVAIVFLELHKNMSCLFVLVLKQSIVFFLLVVSMLKSIIIMFMSRIGCTWIIADSTCFFYFSSC
jgi:hypothetical protein